jgi:hypothetical protein
VDGHVPVQLNRVQGHQVGVMDHLTFTNHDSRQPESGVILSVHDRPALVPFVQRVVDAGRDAATDGGSFLAMMAAVRAIADPMASMDLRQARFEYPQAARQRDYGRMGELEEAHGELSEDGAFLDQMLGDGTLQCWEMGFLLQIALASQGVSSAVRQGYSGQLGMWHAWVEIETTGGVYVLDPTRLPPAMTPVGPYRAAMDLSQIGDAERAAQPNEPRPIDPPAPPPVQQDANAAQQQGDDDDFGDFQGAQQDANAAQQQGDDDDFGDFQSV